MRLVTAADGEQIRKARRRRGWSQRELALRSGVGSRTIGRIERGETPTSDTAKLEQLQAYLKVGPYASTDEHDETYDPPLSKATAGELGAEVMKRLVAGERLIAGLGPTSRPDLTKPGIVTMTEDDLDGALDDEPGDERAAPPTAG